MSGSYYMPLCRLHGTAKRHYYPDEKDGGATEDQIPYIVRLMLQYGVSYECYHEMTQVVKQLPRSHKVQ